MTPLSTVIVADERHERHGQAGVVEAVEKNEAGDVIAALVDLDTDRQRVAFAPEQLRILKAH